MSYGLTEVLRNKVCRVGFHRLDGLAKMPENPNLLVRDLDETQVFVIKIINTPSKSDLLNFLQKTAFCAINKQIANDGLTTAKPHFFKFLIGE